MRVLMLSKACGVGAYQRKLEELAALGVELTVAVPPLWVDERGALPLERVYTQGYTLLETPILLNGNFHLHFYPRFGNLIKQVQPDLVHVDEEPYNLATFLAVWAAQARGVPCVFFSWQNIMRRYPPPFAQMEAYVLKHCVAGLVGNREAEQVWRAKGFGRALFTVPQFGVDPALFTPPAAPRPERPFTVGYAGRLVPEKGVDVALQALASVPGARLRVAGSGPEAEFLRVVAEHYGVADRVQFEPPRPSTAMPGWYAEVDALVLPSRTRRNWKEQFGRVLIEAMACGVPVIGSHSGAIPEVIGPAGLTCPEDDPEALAAHLRQLAANPALRQRLGEQSRARVLAHYTQHHIAQATLAAYQHALTTDH